MTHSAIVAFKRRMTSRQVSRGRWMPVLLSALALVTAGPAAWASSLHHDLPVHHPRQPVERGCHHHDSAGESATEFTVAGGTVTFTDTYNGVSEVLGTVQVQSTNGNPGTAILETEVGGVGTHQFLATYNGTSVFSTSSSTPQSVTFAVPIRPQLRWQAPVRRQLHTYWNRIRVWSVGAHRNRHFHGHNLECCSGHRPAQPLHPADRLHSAPRIIPSPT